MIDRLGGFWGSRDADEDFDDDVEDFDDTAELPPSPVGQDERRMQVRAYNHWASLLGNGTLPHIEDLEPEFLGDFGPYSVLLDLSGGSQSYTEDCEICCQPILVSLWMDEHSEEVHIDLRREQD